MRTSHAVLLLFALLPAISTANVNPASTCGGSDVFENTDLWCRWPKDNKTKETWCLDFAQVPSDSVDDCCALCTANATAGGPCTAWSYNFANKLCFMKAPSLYNVTGYPTNSTDTSGRLRGNVTAKCLHDTDCSLNGLCQPDGACKCDTWWSGPKCEKLRLKPAPVNGGYRQKTTSSWGGNVWHNKSDGIYHLFVSEFVNHCGLRSWGTNSRIVHATSKSAVGPYEFADEALPPQAHNAHIAQDPATGMFLLYHIHVPNETCTVCNMNCTNGTTPRNLLEQLGKDKMPRHQVGKIVGPHSGALHSSTSITGPWSGVNLPNVGCNNPSPFIHPNGTVVRACAQHGYIPGVDKAKSWNSTYTPPANVTCANLGFHFESEDAVVWTDARGNYHLLSHAIGPWPMPWGVHAFSLDGLQWLCGDLPPYDGNVTFDDGSKMELDKRERPKLLFADDGTTPLVLFNGVCPYPHDQDDYSFTLAQEIMSD